MTTEEQISNAWRKEKPSIEAQKIRSQIAHEIDVNDDIPEYVWDILDIAVQRTLSTLTRPISGVAENGLQRTTEAELTLLIDEHIDREGEGANNAARTILAKFPQIVSGKQQAEE